MGFLIKARKTWLKIHRWLGLVVGLFFVLMGLTGSYLVFYQEIDTLINPDWIIVKPATQQAELETILERCSEAKPEWFLHSVTMPSKDNEAMHVWFTPSEMDDSEMWEMLVNPYTAEVLGSRAAVPTMDFTLRNLSNTVYTLHYNLWAGVTGATMVGIIGLALLFSIVSGLVLWFPKGKNWGKGFLIKTNASKTRLFYDMHRAVGIYSFALLALIAFTGVFLALPDYLRPIIYLFSPQQSQDEYMPTTKKNIGTNISADLALKISHETLPNGVLGTFWLPDSNSNAWRFETKVPGYVGLAGGPNSLYVSTSGEIVHNVAHKDTSAGKRFLAWQLPLHDGSAAGLLGRVLVCALGLVPLIMMCTGLYLWLKKRKASRKML